MLLCINCKPSPLGSIMYVITMLCWTVSTAWGVFVIQNSGHNMLPLNGHAQRHIPLTQRTVSNVIRVCSHANLHDPQCHRSHVERVCWMQNAVYSWLEPHHPQSGTEREISAFHSKVFRSSAGSAHAAVSRTQNTDTSLRLCTFVLLCPSPPPPSLKLKTWCLGSGVLMK